MKRKPKVVRLKPFVSYALVADFPDSVRIIRQNLPSRAFAIFVRRHEQEIISTPLRIARLVTREEARGKK